MERTPNSQPSRLPVIVTATSWWGEMQIRSVRPAGQGQPTHLLHLEGGEVFVVHEDTNKSDGLGPRRQHSRHLSLASAIRAAAGLGVQGSLGEITLHTLVERPLTAVDDAGNTVQIATTTELHPVSWAARLTPIEDTA